MNWLKHRAQLLPVCLAAVALLALLGGCSGRPTPTSQPSPAAQQTTPIQEKASTATTFLSPQPFDSAVAVPKPVAGTIKASGLVAFHSDRSGNLDIWVMRDDGSDLRQLTNNPERDIEPDWSPDGKQIVFASGRDDPNHMQLYVMNADGSDQHALLPFVAGDELGPRWAPDGKRVAFYMNKDGQLDIYTATLADHSVVNLTSNDVRDLSPAWSSDGKQLAFASTHDGRPHIFVIQADGSNVRQLTSGDWEDTRPDWLPDGKGIVFTSTHSGYPAPWVVPATGGEPVIIADNVLVKNRDARWAGNDMLVFSSDRVLGNWAIYRMNSKGKDSLVLTSGAGLDASPAWMKMPQP